MQVLEQICSAGFWMGCTTLASFYSKSDGRTPPKDAVKAIELYQRACDGGLWTACDSLAYLYAYGPGIPQDNLKAAQLYQKACDNGLRLSCLAVKRFARPPEASSTYFPYEDTTGWDAP